MKTFKQIPSGTQFTESRLQILYLIHGKNKDPAQACRTGWEDQKVKK
jgi:hypothetical protein